MVTGASVMLMEVGYGLTGGSVKGRDAVTAHRRVALNDVRQTG